MRVGNRRPVEVVGVSRKAGKLFRITTSDGRSHLVADDPATCRYLEKGAILEGPDLDDLEGPHAWTAGLILAYALLSRKDRTESQIRKALSDEGIDDSETVDKIVGSLRARGHLNDRRYAEEMILSRKRFHPAGPDLIRRGLREAGVPGELIEACMKENYSGAEEDLIARGLARKKLALMKGCDREKAARRVHGFLARRGFSAGLVNDICARVLRGDISGESDEQQY